jgi:hypothetical protein
MLSRGFALFGLMLTVMILAVTVGFFLVIPRLSTQKLFQTIGQRQQTRESVSAFDETIEFGSLEKISLDSRIALYARPLDPSRPSHIRLRGVALDTFDGRRWMRTTRATGSERQPFEPFHRRSSQFPTRVFLMIQPPGITNYLFGDNFPEALRMDMDQQFMFDPLSNAVWLGMPLSKEFHYTVISRSEDLESRRDPKTTMRDLKGTRGFGGKPFGILHGLASEGPVPALAVASPLAAMAALVLSNQSEEERDDSLARAVILRRFQLPNEYRRRCLRVPSALDRARLSALASEWTASARTAFEQSRAIESYLRLNYAYSLQPQTTGSFIEDFLFRTKKGHCEYFATSMVMLLRSLGIPSRVVNGYYCAEWNGIARSFTVRQRDAHSWVEAYFDDYGWMTFDPTPPVGVGRASEESFLSTAYNRVMDAAKVRWYRYMIDYNYTDQIGVVRGVIRLTYQLRDLLESISLQIRTANLVSPAPTSWFAAVALVAVCAAAAAVAGWYSLRRFRARGGAIRRRHARTVVRFYAEILKLLERLGFERRFGQTPREFASSIAVSNPDLRPFADITEVYYQTRFHGIPPSAAQSRRVHEFLSQLRATRQSEKQ